MPPKKSRRLPGGKVRRPEAQGARPAPATVPSPADEALEDEPDQGSNALDISETAVTLEDYRVARAAPEPPPVSSASRRIRERRARVQVGRSGPSAMEVAARNYGHVRGDLIRILLLAVVMFGIIVALSFVLE